MDTVPVAAPTGAAAVDRDALAEASSQRPVEAERPQPRSRGPARLEGSRRGSYAAREAAAVQAAAGRAPAVEAADLAMATWVVRNIVARLARPPLPLRTPSATFGPKHDVPRHARMPPPTEVSMTGGSCAVDAFEEGLRCQDVHSGLRNVDPNAPLLGPLSDTRVVGMAATLAGLIRGRDYIVDAQALMQVAAAQLDVNMLSFGEVIALLEDAGYVSGVQRRGGKIVSFAENVPLYGDLYQTLGDAWRDRSPTELEQQLLVVVHGLSQAPVPLESVAARFDLDTGSVDELLDVATRSGLVRSLRTIDGDIAYTPFYGFENPQLLESLVLEHGTDQLISEFEAVRARQGLELSQDRYPLLTGAVAGGLILAPSVELPGGRGQAAFAALPYAADTTLLTHRKPVLDKALAVLACLRCAESHAEFNTLSAAALVNVINKLLDPNRGFLAPNSAHRRQYALLRNAGLLVFAPDTMPGGSWVTPTFVDTEDNREALKLARELIVHGELVENRVNDTLARQALNAGAGYTAPMQTTQRLREFATPSAKDFEKVFDKAMGRSAL